MKKRLGLLLSLAIAASVAIAGYLYLANTRIDRFAHAPFGTADTKLVDIPNGTGPKGVASLLAKAGVVSSADSTYAYLKRTKLGPKLKAGEYAFAGPLTPEQVITRIVSGQVRVYRFTVPEGLRVEEILPIVAGSELKLDLSKLQGLSSDARWVRALGVPADGLEGFLYPDTYTFTRGASEAAVLAKMVSRALEEHQKAAENKKPGITLSLLEAMTLASIVEKETGAPEERARIACVFHNRLRLHMKLQTDPTVIYAMMLARGRYTKNITKKDLETDHPYNTYTRKGLPPGPIASAGAAALQAVYHPLDCQDLFFVSKNDGTHVFCPDLRCHEDNVEKWQRKFFRNKRRKGKG
ncbi:MAG: endolytic transglycosylase MltG [Myxococcota bacterium]